MNPDSKPTIPNPANFVHNDPFVKDENYPDSELTPEDKLWMAIENVTAELGASLMALAEAPFYPSRWPDKALVMAGVTAGTLDVAIDQIKANDLDQAHDLIQLARGRLAWLPTVVDVEAMYLAYAAADEQAS